MWHRTYCWASIVRFGPSLRLVVDVWAAVGDVRPRGVVLAGTEQPVRGIGAAQRASQRAWRRLRGGHDPGATIMSSTVAL